MAVPPARTHPTIEVRSTWDFPWVADAQLRVAGPVSLTIGGQAEGTLRLVRRYGPKVKFRADAAWTIDAEPRSYMNYYVRLVEPNSETVLWQGMILQDERKLSQSDGVPRGQQMLTAFGPAETARRCEIDTSFWSREDVATQELGWVPSVNYRDEAGNVQGNRGALIGGQRDSYIYGLDPGQLWSNLDYLKYIVSWHLQQYDGAGRKIGPIWTVTGQTDILDDMILLLRLRPSQSALAIIRRLVRPEHGLDFAILPTTEGYDIKIFIIAGRNMEFGTATLPANPASFTVNPTTDAGVVACKAELSARERVDRLELIGERIESCFSIDPNQLQPLWSAAQETAYKAGTGTPADPASEHDAHRTDDPSRLVYTGVAADAEFDLQTGLACPILDAEGNVTGTGADRQNEFRETLRLLPLREGGDYTTSPPDLTDAQTAYIPPLALVYISSDLGYVPADRVGAPDTVSEGLKLTPMSVYTAPQEWGLVIKPNKHNHELAKNHWAAGSPAASEIDPDTEGIDYEDTYLTIAAKMDQRVRCYEDAVVQMKDGSKKILHVPGAKLEYLASTTVIGRDGDGTTRLSPAAGVVLRNDANPDDAGRSERSKLHQMMAGALDQYLIERFRATIAWNSIQTYLDKLGTILVMGSDEGDLADRWALITAIEWDFEAGRTVLKAGYAT